MKQYRQIDVEFEIMGRIDNLRWAKKNRVFPANIQSEQDIVNYLLSKSLDELEYQADFVNYTKR